MKILTVDDSATIREKLKVLLTTAFPDVEVIQGASGIDAVALADKHNPDLIIMDIQMPEMTGHEAMRVLQNRENTRSIPVIFLTGALQESEDIVRGLELGAVEYVTKPIHDPVFLARVKVMLRLKAQQERILQLSLHDPLTECYNRRFMMQRLKEEFSRSRRTLHPVCGIMIDIDHFKTVNDTYGHETGDQVLVKVVSVLKVSIRTYDVLARYGGEEFFILLPNTSVESGVLIAERTRRLLEQVTVETQKAPIKVTASFGVAGFEGAQVPEDEDELLRRTDEALYAAKKGGRNRVEIFK
jgi:two-component system cell cycle response regulator